MRQSRLAWPRRLWAKVDIRDVSDCWEWRGWRDSEGYGLILLDGRNRRAHQVTYEEIIGLIPDGLEIDHLCRNRGCVNPWHLEPVTHKENMRRSGGLRQACRHGHALTPDNIRIHRGARYCKTCNRLASRRRYERLRRERQEDL
jgi:hypothetical protein